MQIVDVLHGRYFLTHGSREYRVETDPTGKIAGIYAKISNSGKFEDHWRSLRNPDSILSRFIESTVIEHQRRERKNGHHVAVPTPVPAAVPVPMPVPVPPPIVPPPAAPQPRPAPPEPVQQQMAAMQAVPVPYFDILDALFHLRRIQSPDALALHDRLDRLVRQARP